MSTRSLTEPKWSGILKMTKQKVIVAVISHILLLNLTWRVFCILDTKHLEQSWNKKLKTFQ